jgi:hypothetical protein
MFSRLLAVYGNTEIWQWNRLFFRRFPVLEDSDQVALSGSSREHFLSTVLMEKEGYRLGYCLSVSRGVQAIRPESSVWKR